jgi:hypothetical protein
MQMSAQSPKLQFRTLQQQREYKKKEFVQNDINGNPERDYACLPFHIGQNAIEL